MRRIAVACSAVLALALTVLSAGAAPAPSWALPQIRIVVAHGLLGTAVHTFRPADPLTRSELNELQAGLADTVLMPASLSTAPATIAQLDSGLVGALRLTTSARRFSAGARAAGLTPPARFGTEVVARLLELRTNHPAGHDDLELFPSEPATRAEAAYSAARVLAFHDWEPASVEQSSLAFELPSLTDRQRDVLQTAVRFVGYPYVWGGESEKAESPFGAQAHGGFDCSGFVWRVYKLQKYPDAPTLASTLHGRTTYEMSGEVQRSKRIAFARLQPADLVFFGAAGPRSKPAQVDHMGIYLGNGWFIHSSRQGVYLSTLTGWYRTKFAWARRPLAEAGSSPAPPRNV